MHTLARRHPHADIAVGAAVLLATIVTTAPAAAGARLDAVSLALAALACAVLAGRQHFPVAVLLLSAVAAEAFLVRLGGEHGSMVLAAPLIALYTVAERTTRRRALLVGALSVLALVGLHMLNRPSSWLGAENVALASLGGLALAAGDASRNRRAYLAEVEERARRVEAEREADATRRLTEERLRIARDLHDAVGHQLALIHVQAGVATHTLTADPAQAGEALGHIGRASRAALRELNDTILLLRRPDEAAAPIEPVAGLASLEELYAGFRQSGLRINTRVDGPWAVPVSVDVTAYRILQESLTNVCKHAGPAEIDIRLLFGRDDLRIVVDNRASDGAAKPEPPSGGTGLGLAGMRERVAAMGGDLQAGPRPDGGFRVAARLPLGVASVGT